MKKNHVPLMLKPFGMMKTSILLTYTIIWLATSVNILGQNRVNLADQFAKGLKTANSEALASYFGPFVLLNINDTQNVESQGQAKLKLTNFFKQNPVLQVTLAKSEIKDDQEYYIFYYQTKSVKWRVYILLSLQEQEKKIYQMDIVKTNDL